jgi:hypothetical protein
MSNSPMTLRERVVLYFGRNPDEELTSHDVLAKWGISDVRIVRNSLRYAVRQGVIACNWRPGQLAVYSAGPVLRQEVGA